MEFNRDNKLVINLVGVPASGKSTLINNIQEYFKDKYKIGSIDIMTDNFDNYVPMSDDEIVDKHRDALNAVGIYDCDILIYESNVYNGLMFTPLSSRLIQLEMDMRLELLTHSKVARFINVGLAPDSKENMFDRINNRGRSEEGFDEELYDQIYYNYYDLVGNCDYIISNGCQADVTKQMINIIFNLEEKPQWTFVMGDEQIGKTTYINETTKRLKFNINIKITDMNYINHLQFLHNLLQSSVSSNITFDRCPFIEDLIHNDINITNGVHVQGRNRVCDHNINRFLEVAKNFVDLQFVVIVQLSKPHSGDRYIKLLKKYGLSYTVYVRP